MTFDILEWLARRQEQQQARIEALSAEIAEINHRAGDHGSQIKSLLTRMASAEALMDRWKAYAGKAYFVVIPIVLVLANADPETVVRAVLKIVAVGL